MKTPEGRPERPPSDPTQKPYRPNVGAVLCRSDGGVLMCERIAIKGAWQFPQGGVDEGESREEAMWRELEEELGLSPPQRTCRILAVSSPVRYTFPPDLDNRVTRRYAGQEQTLFLLAFSGTDADFRLDAHKSPEFRAFRWVPPDEARGLLWEVKRPVYDALVAEHPQFFSG